MFFVYFLNKQKCKIEKCENRRFSHFSLLSIIFERSKIAFCLKSRLATASGSGDGLSVVRVGNIASRKHSWNSSLRTAIFGNDVTSLVGLYPWLEYI